MNRIEPFRIAFEPAAVRDLHSRLAHARLADSITDDGLYGMRKTILQDLIEAWKRYDTTEALHRLNRFPHYVADIDGARTHFLHIRGKGSSPRALLLINGWPSSFVEYFRVIEALSDPASGGGSANEAFDIVMPALPGYGYSAAPVTPFGIDPVTHFHGLMVDVLGYERYLVSGTDIGAGVATRLGMRYPDAVQGIHISTVVDPPLGEDAPALTPAENHYLRMSQQWDAEEGAYQHLQCTRPQTLGFALNDSPVGLASWIVEKFYFWSDHGGDLFSTFPLPMLIDNLMIYWMTGCIASSMRYYFDAGHYRPPLTTTDAVKVPTAVSMWPKDLVVAPREWAERFYNVVHYRMHARGGHFPAWEVPQAYVDDLRQLARATA